jgi:hypothetical protein
MAVQDAGKACAGLARNVHKCIFVDIYIIYSPCHMFMAVQDAGNACAGVGQSCT